MDLEPGSQNQRRTDVPEVVVARLPNTFESSLVYSRRALRSSVPSNWARNYRSLRPRYART